LDIAEEDKLHSIGYLPTRVRYFRKLTQAQPLPTDFTFIDIGCGKGRILMAAAEYGFRRMIGIDISPRLCEQARRNLETFRRRTATQARFRIECTNVLRTELDHTRQVFYLYRPFDRTVMGGFVHKLKNSLRAAPRKIWMIINQMECRDLLERDGLFLRRRRIVYGAGEFDVYYHDPDRSVA
jgi:SAM-dependent methyltransferase